MLYHIARRNCSSSNTLISSVAVACEVRLSCSVFTVYSVLLSVSLVARYSYSASSTGVQKAGTS